MIHWIYKKQRWTEKNDENVEKVCMTLKKRKKKKSIKELSPLYSNGVAHK